VSSISFGKLGRLVNAELSHFDEQGHSRMVDVGDKPITRRFARAAAIVRMRPETQTLIRNRQLAKGDVLEVARLAGIQAAKRTFEWIPLCHLLPLDSVEIEFQFPDPQRVAIETRVWVSAKTGVEMEALVAASTAALTIYDMCKAVDRAMSVEQVRLEEKLGGKSGHFVRPTD
jgi:cyclic pyranopterin phosphate synthase